MPVVESYKPGSFSWADLGTTDQNAAKAFYGEILGWTANEMPMGDGQTYSMMQKNGLDAGGIAMQQPGAKAMGAPPAWTNYVTVENADDAVAKAASLGGNVLMPAMDVMEAGRMAVLQDPTGAVFAVWQPGQHKGAGFTQDPGGLAWQELYTTDTEKAGKFYNGLFGWEPKPTPMPDMDYTIFQIGDRQLGGMMKIDPSMGPIPPNWMTYWSVENADASIEKIKSLGGKIYMGPHEVPGVGRFAICADPQGAAFSIIAPSGAM